MEKTQQRKKKTMDGNQAAAHVSYAYSDAAAIYPITPSSTMAEYTDEWSAQGRENIFGQTVHVSEMQSEAGAAGAVHGSLAAGALTTTFTASQGLLLMIPNLYKIAGELLPGVFHVAARTVATHALSIFGDHSDIYACRQTGAAMLASGSVQEVMDLTPAAHLSAVKGRVPFINFFDGFRTSHEMQKIETWDYGTLKEMADMEAIASFRRSALNPNCGKMMGSAQNADIYFQAREACNPYYNALPAIVEKYMEDINRRIGSNYGLFNYYGSPDAEHVIIAMGSVCQTIKETIDYFNAKKDAQMKTGLIEVHLYRPFSASHLLQAIPENVKQITVLDRTKEPGAAGEPLFLDVIAALRDTAFHNIPVFSGRYGLSSKDTTPSQINAVFQNMGRNKKPVFTVGITDDVTNMSLPAGADIHAAPSDAICCKFWGLGGDGTVSANKNSVKIIGNHTDKYVQAYFDYDSKKSRGLTVSHLRFGNSPIRSAYLISRADFAACHNPVYLHKYNMVQEVKDGGTFLLNCYFKEEDLEQYMPGQVKRYIAEHNIKFYVIDAIRIGKEIGLNNKISTILQAAFFRLTGILPIEEARRLMKEAAEASYQKKGDKVIRMNFEAIDRGIEDVTEVSVPPEWKHAAYEPLDEKLLPGRPALLDYVENIQKPIVKQEGNALPVSAFLPYVNGAFPSGSTAHERRNVATEMPSWILENCIQCNRCSFVCPHAVIRPAVMSEEELSKAPEGMKFLPMQGLPGFAFSVTVSEADCTGCGSCAGVCPGRQGQKALEMRPVKEHEERQQYFDYGKSLPPKQEAVEKFKENTIKGSQFKRPLLEFHGACAGCGETPYAKLVTQLFGERMYIANATGCSSIWANSSPSTAYTVNAQGQGPAWSNSLFEDAAEFGYGMLLAQTALRKWLKQQAEMLYSQLRENPSCRPSALQQAVRQWLDTFSDGRENQTATDALIDTLESGMHFSNDKENRTAADAPIDTLESGIHFFDGKVNQTAADAPIDTLESGMHFSDGKVNQTAADASIDMLESGIQKSCTQKTDTPESVPTKYYTPESATPAPSIAGLCRCLLENKDFLSKKSQWVFGGDGWAYDIGFAGLDHVLASGEDINILVFNTEIYSNTGGQASKATPMGSIAKFASGGKKTAKKNLAAMAMNYGYVYVAQIAMGADYNQAIKAVIEAESYPGPSLIIAYSPCISHGIRAGMGSAQHEEAKAVEAGYWHLYRFHPSLKKEGKNPFILDSKEPSFAYDEFLSGENRYEALKKADPEAAAKLFAEAAADAKERYQYLKNLVALYGEHLV